METQEASSRSSRSTTSIWWSGFAASRRFYEAVFKVLDIPIGGEAKDFFWADELFVSSADSRAAGDN